MGAVYYARDTVQLTLKGRQDARDQHEAQIAEMKAATAASAEQHRIEMEDRRRVAEADMLERQLRHLGVVIEMVLGVGNYAREIARQRHGTGEVSVAAVAQIPSMLITVDSALAVLAALGIPTPTKTATLIELGRFAGTTITSVASMSVEALLELQQLALDVGAGQVRTSV